MCRLGLTHSCMSFYRPLKWHRFNVWLTEFCWQSVPTPWTSDSEARVAESKAIHLIRGQHGEILGRLEVGWEKVECWSTKATISLKRVKIDEKLLWMAYRKSPMLFRTVPFPTPYGPPFPRLEVCNPPSKTPVVIISGTVSYFKFCAQIFYAHS